MRDSLELCLEYNIAFNMHVVAHCEGQLTYKFQNYSEKIARHVVVGHQETLSSHSPPSLDIVYIIQITHIKKTFSFRRRKFLKKIPLEIELI